MSKKNILNNKTDINVIVINSSNYNYINAFFLLLSLLPLYFLFSSINTYSLNLPIQDDYDAILGFLNTWTSSNDKLPLMFIQHNEHIIFPSRLVYILYLKLTGNINFNSLIIIGNIQLVLITFIIIGFIRRITTKFFGISVFILSLCLFDLSNYENSNFSMAGMQNYGVILFFLASLFFYSLKENKIVYTILAVFFQFLCAFSSGNGIIAGITLLLFNLFNKDKKNIITSFVSFTLFSSIYFLIFKSSPNSIKGKNISDITSFFLKLSGGHFGYEERTISAIFLLVIMIGLLLYKNWNKINRELLPLLSIIFFVLSSIGVVAIFRSGGLEGIEHDSYGSRYLIYPHIFSASVFILLCYSIENYKYAWAFVLICSIFFIKSYKENYAYGEAGFERTNYRFSTKNYYYPDSLIAKKIAIESCSKKIYCIEDHKQ